MLSCRTSAALGLEEPEPTSTTPAAEPQVEQPEAERAEPPPPRDEETLPDAPPPQSPQAESSAGGGEEVKATKAASTEGASKYPTLCDQVLESFLHVVEMCVIL